MEELGRRVAEVEERKQHSSGAGEVVGDEGQQPEWSPPRRGRGLPDAGVVTLEEQPDEEHAFGPAALVAEWREIITRERDGSKGSRVDRDVARVRRWELEAEMLGEFRMTLPTDTKPLDRWRRQDHVRRKEEALEEARRELSRAKRARLLRRRLTLGLWRLI